MKGIVYCFSKAEHFVMQNGVSKDEAKIVHGQIFIFAHIFLTFGLILLILAILPHRNC